MDKINLKGLTRLENNVVIMNNASLRQLVGYIEEQTNAINTLVEELNKANLEIAALKSASNTNTKNIKTIAIALKGVYTNE